MAMRFLFEVTYLPNFNEISQNWPTIKSTDQNYQARATKKKSKKKMAASQAVKNSSGDPVGAD